MTQTDDLDLDGSFVYLLMDDNQVVAAFKTADAANSAVAENADNPPPLHVIAIPLMDADEESHR